MPDNVGASKIGNNVVISQSYTRDEILKALNGVTEKSSEISYRIGNGEIGLNVLGDDWFEKYLGVSSDTVALQVGDQIYVRSSSASLLSDIVHEGTHALDFLNHLDQMYISSRQGEINAYTAERAFQIGAGLPVQFESIDDLLVHIWSNYKR